MSVKEFVRLNSVSKQYKELILSEGEYQHCDQGNLKRMFKKHNILKELYLNQPRFEVTFIISIRVKQAFLDGLSKKADYPLLNLYFNLKVIGGPIQSTSITPPHALASYVNMQIDLSNGGGIYEMKGIVDEDGNVCDCMILFSGTGGSNTLRETVGQLFREGKNLEQYVKWNGKGIL